MALSVFFSVCSRPRRETEETQRSFQLHSCSAKLETTERHNWPQSTELLIQQPEPEKSWQSARLRDHISLVLQWLGFGFGWPLLLGLTCRDQTLGLRSDVPLYLALSNGERRCEAFYFPTPQQ